MKSSRTKFPQEALVCESTGYPRSDEAFGRGREEGLVSRTLNAKLTAL